MKTNGIRKKSIAELSAEVRARREALAAEYRQRLEGDLKLVEQPSAAQTALLAAAVSSYVEMVEISSRFLRGKASEAAMRRLSLARGQLARTLRLLGMAGDPNDSGDGAHGEDLATWIKTHSQPPPSRLPVLLAGP